MATLVTGLGWIVPTPMSMPAAEADEVVPAEVDVLDELDEPHAARTRGATASPTMPTARLRRVLETDI